MNGKGDKQIPPQVSYKQVRDNWDSIRWREDMTKDNAISTIKSIQSGEWARNAVDVPKGKIAEELWDDNKFSYGMEYGAIAIIMQIFGVTEEDLSKGA